MRLHLLAVALAALTLAACGGSDSPSTSTTSAENAPDTARVRLQDCLREHGVELGQAAQGDVDQDKVDEAMEACDRYRQEAFGDLSDEDRQELQDELTRLTQCMRDHGIDVPDLEVGKGAAVRQFDRDDPDVQKALDACRDQAPQLGEAGGRR